MVELRRMPKNFQKSLQEYLSKIKKQTPHLHFSPRSLSSTTSKIFSGCKHPKSLSFSMDRKHDKESGDELAATLDDVDRFLVENFRSLYGQEVDHKNGDRHENTYESKSRKAKGGAFLDSPKSFTMPPDLYGSHRFFISQSSSGSLLDMGSTSADPEKSIPSGVEGCIAVLTMSKSLYEDFRRSMQEVIEAKVHHKQSVDWDFMEELLFSYLRLNEKTHYRYILSAFIDLVVTLRQASTRGSEPESELEVDGSQSEGSANNSKGKRRQYL